MAKTENTKKTGQA